MTCLSHIQCVCVCAQTVSVNKASRVQQSTGCKCGGTAHEKTSQRAEISSQLLWKQKVPCVYAGSRKLITTPCAAMSENRHSCTPPLHTGQRVRKLLSKASGFCILQSDCSKCLRRAREGEDALDCKTSNKNSLYNPELTSSVSIPAR